MTDQEHADAIRKATEALNAVIEAARQDKVFTRVTTINDDHLADWQPTVLVSSSVMKPL